MNFYKDLQQIAQISLSAPFPVNRFLKSKETKETVNHVLDNLNALAILVRRCPQLKGIGNNGAVEENTNFTCQGALCERQCQWPDDNG